MSANNHTRASQARYGLRRFCSQFTNDDGIGLIEFVIAAAILFTVVVAIMGAMVFSAQATQMDAKRVSGLSLANQRIEQARNLPYDDVGVYYESGGYGNPPGTILATEQIDGFTVDTTVFWARDETSGRATYKNIIVTVSWDEPRAGTVALETSIYGKSLLVNTGDASILVLESDTGEPLEGITVSLTPSSGSSRSMVSDENGEAFFGFVPSGSADVGASSTEWVFDLIGVTPTEIIPDSLSRLTIYAERPSTAIITVVDNTGQPISDADVLLSDAYSNVWTGRTNGSGEVVFNLLLQGWYDVEATHTGFAKSSGSFEIPSSGQTVSTELVLHDASGLTVNVTSADTGMPISGANVSVVGPLPGTAHVTGSPASTNAEGVTSFDILVVTEGTYRILAEMADYTSSSVEIVMIPGADYVVDLALEPTLAGSLRIDVVNRWGNPKRYGRVRVWNASREFDQIITADRQGRILLEGLVPGRYTVRGWTRGSQVSTDVDAGQESHVTVMSR